LINVQPQWIAKMYAGKTGRDHLGLGSVSSDQILPSLSPGINVLTFHPRYHSLYVFLLYEFWQRDIVRNRSNWIAFYRPREFIFSVGAFQCDQETHGEMRNVVGGQKTGSADIQAQEIFDTTYHYIDSPLGGYGLYYRTVMTEMGLVYPGGSGLPYPVDLPSEDGEKVALAFREAIKDTTYYQKFFEENKTEISLDVVKEYIREACLCRLKTPEAPDHELLLELFTEKGTAQDAKARRETFRLFLDLAKQTDGTSLDDNIFRQLIYFQSTETGLRYTPSVSIISTYIRWRLYQAREYYAYALNALWVYLSEWGIAVGGETQSISLDEFWQHLEKNLDFTAIAKYLGVETPRLNINSGARDLLAWINTVGVAGANDVEKGYQKNLLNEHDLYELIGNQKVWQGVELTAMFSLLLLVAERFSTPSIRLRPEWEISKMGANGRLSVDRFLRELYDRVEGGATVAEIVRWIYRAYIITQHQMVASSKLPDNTFRFRLDGKQLRFYNLTNPLSFMNSRFDAISTTIYELGLCGDLKADEHALSSSGEKLLADGSL
jgi:hypothetical protein